MKGKTMIDFGNSGSAGPFIQWMASASKDGEFPPKVFVLRAEDGKRVIENFKAGVVIDIDALKLGWCFSDGVAGRAPEWKWNATLSKFADYPGEGWKKGFSLPVALAPNEMAVWEQAQAAAYSAVTELFKAVAHAQRAAGTLPVVRHVGENVVKSARGVTIIPILEIVKWIPRPAYMGGGAPAFEPQPAQQPASPPPAPVAAPAASAAPF